MNQEPCERCGRVGDAGELARLRQSASYYEAMHARAVEREARVKREYEERLEKQRGQLQELREEVQQLKTSNRDLDALVKLREKQAFGKNSERQPRLALPAGEKQKRSRGQQKGSRGHGRRAHENLPERQELIALPPEEACCPQCQRPRAKKSNSEPATIIEIEVKAHRRRVSRERCESTCGCEGLPKIIVAPSPGQLIPRGLMGVSVWVMVLMDKYLHQRPTYRLLQALRLLGIDLSRGTITDGLQRLAPLFVPIMNGLREQLKTATHWHADETGWYVFVKREGKKGHRWNLWVFLSADVVVFELDPFRSSKVIRKVLGELVRGILSVDRYSAYKAFMKLLGGQVLLAFCWAHVRRDFLAVAVKQPELAAWATVWVERIGRLYKLNDARLAVRHAGGDEAAEKKALTDHLANMQTARCDELILVENKGVQHKLLKSLGKHWSGLLLFVEHPEVPLDNSAAERAVRGPVNGRKNYYGSRAEWGGELAVSMFSIFQTLEQNGLNSRLWLTAYLQACADNGGAVPLDAKSYLPWNLSEERRALWALAPSASARTPVKRLEPAAPPCVPPQTSAPTAPATTPEPPPALPCAPSSADACAPPCCAPTALAPPSEPLAALPCAPSPADVKAPPRCAPTAPAPPSEPLAALPCAPSSDDASTAPPERVDEVLRTRVRRARSRGDPPNCERAAAVAGGDLQTSV